MAKKPVEISPPRARTDASAHGNQAALAGFAEATNHALALIDAEGRITYLNAAAEELFGYSRATLVGGTLDTLMPERFRNAHRAGVHRAAAGAELHLGGKTVEVMALRADGSEIPIEVTIARWQGPNGPAMGAIMRDISERRERDRRLLRLATRDPLTGLPNRGLLVEKLDALLEQGRGATVLQLEVGGLKDLNDNVGHNAGDTLLQTLAIRLPGVLPQDAFLARHRGDEFVVMLADIADPLVAIRTANALLDAFAKPFSVGQLVLKVDARIGVAIGPAHGGDAEVLLAAADLALHRARSDGGQVRLFEPMMRNAVARRRSMQDELLGAIANGEFALHYQPQIDIESGSIVGAEALLRWNHPTRGLLMPDSFLSVLEAHSLALHAGGWVLDEACRQAAEWCAGGLPPLRMSVNLFSAQVGSKNLFEAVVDALQRHRLAPEQLGLEVTETIVLANDERFKAPFRALRDAHVDIAFDDFGTGHASLSMLKRFPVTTLKIDRSFVSDLLVDRFDASIVNALLGMGHSMGLKVVAEGVETREQEAVLYAMGCRLGQGYLYSRPLPPADFATLLRAPQLVGPAQRNAGLAR